MRTLLVAVLAAGAVAALVWGEREHVHAARLALGVRPRGPGGDEAIVVLGFRDRGPRANVVNRWRVRAALRSRDPRAARSVLVLSGGPVVGMVAEADLMARYARELGHRGETVLERESRTTWENVARVIPLIEHADRIAIVSNSFHAAKARIYLRRLRPDLADRLVPAADQRFGEWTLVKPILAVLGRRSLRRATAGA